MALGPLGMGVCSPHVCQTVARAHAVGAAAELLVGPTLGGSASRDGVRIQRRRGRYRLQSEDYDLQAAIGLSQSAEFIAVDVCILGYRIGRLFMLTVSVVIPVYRAEQTLSDLQRKLPDARSELTSVFQTIFVEDGGGDGSWAIIADLARAESSIFLA